MFANVAYLWPLGMETAFGIVEGDVCRVYHGRSGTHRYPQGLLELVEERRTPHTWPYHSVYHLHLPSLNGHTQSETNHCKAGA